MLAARQLFLGYRFRRNAIQAVGFFPLSFLQIVSAESTQDWCLSLHVEDIFPFSYLFIALTNARVETACACDSSSYIIYCVSSSRAITNHTHGFYLTKPTVPTEKTRSEAFYRAKPLQGIRHQSIVSLLAHSPWE